MKTPHLNLKNWDLNKKKVLVRIDGNVPIKNGTIQNDFRLRALIPTLTLLKTAGAHVTIITHIGRPKNQEKKLSTKPIQQWLVDHGYGDIKILENLRFNPGEQNKNSEFAKQLTDGMDYFINDAWGTMHRDDTSITLIPNLFSPENRSLGLLVHEELQALKDLKENPKPPYVLFLGGGKVSTKLPILINLIEQKKTTSIVLLPAIVFTFLKALNKPVGKSLVDDTLLDQARTLIDKAKENNIELLFPLDYTYVENSWDGPIKTCVADKFPANGIGAGVGPLSIKLFKEKITSAQTIFYNGAMGNPKQPDIMRPLHELLKAIAQSDAYSVIGGGNSVAEVEKLNLSEDINYCSTGGGATLLYISDGQLPGLKYYQ